MCSLSHACVCLCVFRLLSCSALCVCCGLSAASCVLVCVSCPCVVEAYASSLPCPFSPPLCFSLSSSAMPRAKKAAPPPKWQPGPIEQAMARAAAAAAASAAAGPAARPVRVRVPDALASDDDRLAEILAESGDWAAAAAAVDDGPGPGLSPVAAGTRGRRRRAKSPAGPARPTKVAAPGRTSTVSSAHIEAGDPTSGDIEDADPSSDGALSCGFKPHSIKSTRCSVAGALPRESSSHAASVEASGLTTKASGRAVDAEGLRGCRVRC